MAKSTRDFSEEIKAHKPKDNVWKMAAKLVKHYMPLNKSATLLTAEYGDKYKYNYERLKWIHQQHDEKREIRKPFNYNDDPYPIWNRGKKVVNLLLITYQD